MTTIKNITGAMAATLAAVVTLTACTSSGHPATNGPSGKASKAASGNTASAHAAVALPKGVTAATKVPTRVPNKIALRKQVTLASCKSAPGGWAAAGTATNKGHSAADYTITVFFTTEHATVIGTAATTVHVPGGGSKRWSVTDKLHAPAKTLCVLRGVG